MHAYLTPFFDRVNELGWRIGQDAARFNRRIAREADGCVALVAHAPVVARFRLHGYGAVNTIQRASLLRVKQDALSTAVPYGPLAAGANGIYAAGSGSSHDDNQIIYKTPSKAGLSASLLMAPMEGPTGSAKLYDSMTATWNNSNGPCIWALTSIASTVAFRQPVTYRQQ